MRREDAPPPCSDGTIGGDGRGGGTCAEVVRANTGCCGENLSGSNLQCAFVSMVGEDAVAADGGTGRADVAGCLDGHAAGCVFGCPVRAAMRGGLGEDAMGCGGQRAAARDGEATGAVMVGVDGGVIVSGRHAGDVAMGFDENAGAGAAIGGDGRVVLGVGDLYTPGLGVNAAALGDDGAVLTDVMSDPDLERASTSMVGEDAVGAFITPCGNLSSDCDGHVAACTDGGGACDGTR